MEKGKVEAGRLEYVDALSGIFILRMVYTHSCSFSLMGDHTAIYGYLSCFLMWFFFKGGGISRPQNQGVALSKGWRKLLRPFFVWSALGLCLDVGLYGLDQALGLGYYADNEVVRSMGSLVANGAVHGNMPVWFLLSYFLVKMLASYVGSWRHPWQVWLLLCIAFAVPFGLQHVNFRYPLYISNTLVGWMGFYLGGKLWGFCMSEKKGMGNVWLLALAILFVSLPILLPCIYDIRTNILWEGVFSLWWIWVIAACCVFLHIFSHSDRLQRLAHRVGLCWIGRESMFVLCIHWPVLVVLDFVRKTTRLNLPHPFIDIYYMGGLALVGVAAWLLLSRSQRLKKYIL